MDLNARKAMGVASHVCLYGGPKSGKTQLASELAQWYDLIWLDLEQGFEPLLKLPEEWQARIQLVNIPDTKDWPIAAETVLKIFTNKPLDICDTHGKVDCAICKRNEAPFTHVDLGKLRGTHDTIVVVDSGTQLSNSFMTRAMGQKGISSLADLDEKAEWEHYRRQGAYLDMVLSAIQQAPYPVIYITHEGEVELEDGTTKLVPLAGSRNFSRNTAKYFGHVVYAQLKALKHTAVSRTTALSKILTGSRTDIAIEGLEAQSLKPFFDGTIAPPAEIKEAKTALNKLSTLKGKGKLLGKK